jgi:hypothetical protein
VLFSCCSRTFTKSQPYQNRLVDYLIDGKSGGNWLLLNQGSANASVKKTSDEADVVVTIPAIKKQIKFKVVDQGNLDKKASVGKCTALSLFTDLPCQCSDRSPQMFGAI